MRKFSGLGFQHVEINSGFWFDRQQLISETSIFAVRDRFLETGRFEAFKCDWQEGKPNQPHIFWDSDFAKWAESVAYIVSKSRNETLEQVVDGIVDLIEENQDKNGYFNIWFTVVEPDKRWTKRTDHELYCAGHLIEAAVAYYQATGKIKFLQLMCRYADYIEQVFKLEGAAAFITPGHPEIELALVKLFRCTGEKRYLELSKFFIDNRGKDDPSQYYSWVNAKNAQDHMPVREQTTAEGHAVRATYLYSGMADIAYEYDDQELFSACCRIFENMTGKRMYITGGIGSSSRGEAFTIDYDLPNLTAYTESCASIGLILFCKRMLQLDPDGRYADIAERALYNGFLSGISLDGQAFFYENPLEIDPKLHKRDASCGDGTTKFPATQRKAVFDCSCCPPNITRLIASLGDLFYTYNDDTIFIHHYAGSTAHIPFGSKVITVVQETSYPLSGQVRITIEGTKDVRLAVRVPYWCENYQFQYNGHDTDTDLAKGYAFFYCHEDVVILDISFSMKPQLIEAAPSVQDDSGRVALQMGPFIYCLEGIDNGNNLRDLIIDETIHMVSRYDKGIDSQMLEIQGYRRDPGDFTALYRTLKPAYIPQILKFIPYYAFANRGETEMIVWILHGSRLNDVQ